MLRPRSHVLRRLCLACVLALATCGDKNESAARHGPAGVAGAAPPTAHVGSAAQLADALRNQSVSRILLTAPLIAAGGELEKNSVQHGGTPISVVRNVTITGGAAAPEAHTLDLGFVTEALELCPGCWLVFSNLTLANERRGNNPSFDIVATGEPGDGRAVVVDNVVRLRLACTDAKTFGAAIDATPRSRLFPNSSSGRQEWRVLDTLRFQGEEYHDQINPTDFALDVPTTFQEGRGRSGGYSVYVHNTIRLCKQFVPKECLQQKSADACVNEAIDAALAKAYAQPGSTLLAVAIAVPLGVAGLLAACAAVWIVRRRRARGGAGPAGGMQGGGSGSLVAASSQLRAASGTQLFQPRALYNKADWQLRNTCSTPLLPLSAGGEAGGDDDAIEFGEFLGAGSYGRCFRARWRAMDVAVKVFDHSIASMEAVNKEAELLLGLPSHPNLIRAFSLLTFTRCKPRRDSQGMSSTAAGSSRTLSAGAPATPPPGLSARPPSCDDSAKLRPGSHSQPLPGTSRGGSDTAAGRATPSSSATFNSMSASATATSTSAAGQGRTPTGPLAQAESYLIMELADCGTLHDLAQHWDPEAEDDAQMLQRLLLLRDTARGLAALHDANIVHGDLNSRNVLVCSASTADPALGMTAKIADLGLSRVMKQQATHRTTGTVGTMSHMPPELLQSGRMSPACDVYSLGVMMWEVYTRKLAFANMHWGRFFEVVVLQNQRPAHDPTMPAEYRMLMESAWAQQPARRPTAKCVATCLDKLVADCKQRLAAPRQPGAAASSSQQQLHGGSAHELGGGRDEPQPADQRASAARGCLPDSAAHGSPGVSAAPAEQAAPCGQQAVLEICEAPGVQADNAAAGAAEGAAASAATTSAAAGAAAQQERQKSLASTASLPPEGYNSAGRPSPLPPV